MARAKTKKRSSRKSSSRKSNQLIAYPLALFLLLVVGVYLAAWTLKANGADILVSAEVHGPAVTSPAAITDIAQDQHFKKNSIYVSGSCPTNAAYVEIFRNNLMSGSAICQNGNFDPLISLSPGENILTVRSFNITDDEGPVSGALTVYYDAPAPLIKTSNQTSAQLIKPGPLILTTSFLYKGYYTGQEVNWPLRITGGTAPYALNVNWGDGNTDVISRGAAGDFTIDHTYSSPGGYKDSYTIKVNAADSSGQKTFIQFFVIVNSQPGSGLAGGVFSKPPPTLNSSHNWLWLAWPAYLVVLVMFLSYWLGEREELIILRRRGLLKRHS